MLDGEQLCVCPGDDAGRLGGQQLDGVDPQNAGDLNEVLESWASLTALPVANGRGRLAEHVGDVALGEPEPFAGLADSPANGRRGGRRHTRYRTYRSGILV